MAFFQSIFGIFDCAPISVPMVPIMYFLMPKCNFHLRMPQNDAVWEIQYSLLQIADPAAAQAAWRIGSATCSTDFWNSHTPSF
jgi:hypothetical protein